MGRPIVIRVTGDVAGADRAFKQLAASATRTAQVVDRAGQLASTAFAGGAIVAGLSAVVTATADYDTAAREAGAAAGANAREFRQLAEAAREAGMAKDQGAVGAKAAAIAERELARAGQNASQIIGGSLASSLQLAAAAGEPVEQSVGTMTAAMGAFGLKASETRAVADQLTTAANSTNATVSDMGLALAQAAPQAALLGQSLTDTNIVLTAMAKQGNLGSDAGTAWKNAMASLNKLTPEGAKLAKELGLSFFDANGNMKDAVSMAGMLERQLGGLNAEQRGAALQTLVGRDGYKALSALYNAGAEGAKRYKKALEEEGTAAEQVAARNAGIGGTVRAATAAWEDAKITIGETAGPIVSRELDRFSEAMKRARDSGELDAVLDDLGTAMESVADAGEIAARVGGGLVQAWGEVPGPLREAAGAFLLVYAASRKVAGLVPGAGVPQFGGPMMGGSVPRGGAQVPAGRPGPSFYPAGPGAQWRMPVPDAPSLGQLRGDAARARAIEQQYRDQARRAGAVAGPFGFLGGRSTLAERTEARAEAARLRQMADAAREERRAATAVMRQRIGERVLPSVSARGIGGAGAAGAIGAAMGGSFLERVSSGAAIGSMGGPWGAAGGAVAAAAGAGIQEVFRRESAAAAKEIEDAARRASGGDKVDPKVREGLKNKQRADAQASGEFGSVSAEQRAAAIRARERLGRDITKRWADDQAGKKVLDTDRLQADLGKRLAGVQATLASGRTGTDPIAKQAGNRAAMQYIAAWESQGKLAKGAGDKIARELGMAVNQSLKGELAKARLDQFFKDSAGKQLGDVKSLISRIGKEYDLGPTARIGFGNATEEGRKQLQRLQEIARTSTGKTKRAAEADAAALEAAMARFGAAVEPAMKRADQAAQNTTLYLGRVGTAAGEVATQIGSIGTAVSGIDDAIASSPAFADVPKPRKKKRAGGPVRSFRAGGRVDIIASPGEVVVEPGGSYVVPGQRVAADTVPLSVDPSAVVLTDDMQDRIAAGQPFWDAVADGAPHFREGGPVRRKFAAGGKVTGGVSWFGGPNDSSTRGRRTALGLSPDTPGVAIRPGATFGSGRPYLGGYWDVHIGGRNSVLRQIDLGPHERTGKRIDVTSAALGRFGYTERSFPTGSTGWAAWLGKDREAALRRAAAGKASGSIATPIMLGRSVRGRDPLVADAYMQAFERAADGVSRVDLRRYPKLGLAPALSEALTGMSFTSRAEVTSSKGKGASSGGWVRPVSGPITSRYGARRAPTKGASTMHDGIDFGVPIGTRVVAAGAGTVTKAGPNGGYGNYLRLAHAGGYASFYAHLDSMSAKLGQRVGKGQAIARSGNTGTSTGPHLHFGMARGGRSINPASVIRMRGGGPVVKRGPDLPAGAGLTAAAVVSAASGSPSDYVQRIDDMLSGLTQARLEQLRRQVATMASAAGSKRAVTRARAALSMVDDVLGSRAGAAVASASGAVSRGQANVERLQTLQRIAGTDTSEAGLRSQMRQVQRALDPLAAERRGLDRQIGAARKTDNKAAVDRLTQQRDALNAAADAFRVQLAELGRAAAEAAEQAREETRARAESMTAAQAAFASLTATTQDDAAAKRGEAANARARAQAAFERGDTGAQGQFDAQAAALDREAAYLQASDGLAQAQLDYAKAQLADDQGGMKAALERQQAIQQQVLAAAQGSGDINKQSEAVDALNALKGSLDALRAEQRRSQEEQIGLLKEQNRILTARDAVRSAQDAQRLGQRFAGRPMVSSPSGRDPWS